MNDDIFGNDELENNDDRIEKFEDDERREDQPQEESSQEEYSQEDVVTTEVISESAEKENTGWINPRVREYYQFSDQEIPNASQDEPSGKRHADRERGLLKKFGLCAAFAVVFGLIAGFVFLGITSLQQTKTDVASGTGVQIPETGIDARTETQDNAADAASEEPSKDEAETEENEDASAADGAETSSTSTVAGVAANCIPSVVAISNVGVQEVEDFFGGVQSYESESSGSGIIVGQNDTELLIATNNHVVTGADKITVTFIDEESAEAQIKGTDAANDLAVVAVELSGMSETTLSQIKVASIGNSDELVVGEQVVAIGNALGYGQSVTSGYVSALNREVTVDNVTANLIQTDAAINPGNSGGALLNMKGELIGINAVKFASSEVEGMGYAIPVSTAEPILDELMNRETRKKVGSAEASYLGIQCQNVTAETQQMYNIPTGVFISSVEEGYAAEKAGMIRGDVITKFDGTTISTYTELVNTLEYYAAGETVSIIVMRAENGEYKEVELTVTLDEKPDTIQ